MALLGTTLLVLLLWPSLLPNLLVASNFIPHGHCYLWKPDLVWLHIVSDSLIGLAYVSISLTLAYLVHRARRDIPYHWMFLAFGLFIIACGATHFMEVWTLWHPTYWLSGSIKLITASASITTAIALPPLIPQILALVAAAKTSEERRLKLETANKELEALYEKLKRLDQVKTEFFANVSHELRTPLTLILEPSEKLIKAELTNEQHHYLEIINRNARLLLKRVNDLLDISKLEAGKMTLDYALVDVAELVRITCAHFDTLAALRKISFSVETPPSLFAQIDPEKFQGICFNLLSNAFKFTPEGGSISCILKEVGVEQDGIKNTVYNKSKTIEPDWQIQSASSKIKSSHCELIVQDSGEGVAPNLRNIIFERYQQGEVNSSHSIGGSGLGLAIVKEFVELHKGAIAVGEAPEGGASFTVKLPLVAPLGESANLVEMPIYRVLESRKLEEWQIVEANSATSLQSKIQNPKSKIPNPNSPLVLVVEDNLDLNRLIADTLAGEFIVASAFDGREGLEKAIQLNPDLILTDMMMAHLNGEQLVREIRLRPELESIPIILLTAKADDALRVQMLREGAQDYLMKPFWAEELLARVNNLIAIKRVREVLQQEVVSKNQDLAVLANEVTSAKRELQKLASELEIRVQERTAELQAANKLLQEEIAERQRTASELYKERERFRSYFALPLVGIAITSPEKGWLEVNDKLCDILGYSRQQLMSMNWAELTHPDDLASDVEQFNRLLMGEIQGYCLDKRFIRKDGQTIHASISAGCVRRADGSVDYVVALIEDITIRKQAIGLLLERESILRSFYNSAPLMMGVVELVDDDILHISDNATSAKLFGLTPEAMQNRLASEIGLPQNYLQMWIERYRSAGEAKAPIRFEYTHENGEGSSWLAATVCPIVTSSEDSQRFCYVVEDITSRKQAEEEIRTLNAELEQRVIERTAQLEAANKSKDELLLLEQKARKQAEMTGLALAQSEARYRAIGESIPYGVWMCDKHGGIIYVSDSFLQLIGVSLEECQAKGWTNWLPQDDVEPAIAAWKNSIENSNFWDYEYKILGTDGRHYAILSRGVPVRDAAGEIACWVGINLDITERKKLQEALKQQTEELERASRLKDEFLAIVSHELRTPINCVLGWATLLRTRKFDEAKADMALETIERNARSQTQLIEDILDISRMSRNDLQLKLGPVNLVPPIQAAINAIAPQAEAKAIQLISFIEPRAVIVSGDSKRLQQVASNLLSNAIKFTQDGGRVEIELSVVTGNGELGMGDGKKGEILRSKIEQSPIPYVKIRVSDSGKGISASFMPYVFDLFRQENGGIRRSHGGLGLGLAIVRHLVELHGGDITIHSAGVGQGTTFIVKLPLLQQDFPPLSVKML